MSNFIRKRLEELLGAFKREIEACRKEEHSEDVQLHQD